MGDVESITDALNSSRTQTFIYDHLHRLTTATAGTYGTLSYTYDEIGNMRTNTRVAGEYKYMQDGNTRPHAIARIGTGPIWTYDANGNITNDGIRSITWDRDNKPRTIGSATFTYDYTGKRAMKASGGSTLRYVSEIYECKTSDTYCTMYIFGAGKRIASKTTQASPYLRYYHGDHLGSMSLTTISNGTKESAMYYYPYGETRTAESNPPSSARYRYTNQEEDAETGLYNYVARHYDPVIGRFMSPDYIVPDYADPQSLNRYSYVLNNPMNRTDPTGHAAPWFHYNVTYEAAIQYGSGPIEARRQAYNAMAVDFSSTAFSKISNYSNIHVMAGHDPITREWQDRQEAIQGGIGTILRSAASGRLNIADHATLDLVTHKGESMQTYQFWEHFNRVDKDGPSIMQVWAKDLVLVNREIRDYYRQFDPTTTYIPGPAIYESRYDLGTLDMKNWPGSVDYFSLASSGTISMPDFYVSSSTSWLVPSYYEWLYAPSESVSPPAAYHDDWNYDWP